MRRFIGLTAIALVLACTSAQAQTSVKIRSDRRLNCSQCRLRFGGLALRGSFCISRRKGPRTIYFELPP